VKRPSEGVILSDIVLVSTAEFTLKSHPVRQQLTRLLKRHIRFNLKRIGQEDRKIKSAGGFLVVDELDNAELAANNLAKILGVSHADACEPTNTDMNEIVERVAKLAERTIKDAETFAVRARRYEPSSLKGKDIEIQAGSEILSRLPKGVKVNLDNPDHTFRVFYGAKDAYISVKRFDGPAGLPVGSQGSLLGLATDPAYSPLAFYLLMKRGAVVWPVIADLPPQGGYLPDMVLKGLKKLRQYVPKNRYSARLITLDDPTTQALASVRPDLQRAFCIRLAFRVVKHLTRHALGLVTADRFGQFGVESLKDLRAVDPAATFPVYRPLLTLDEARVKQELNELGLAELETEAAPTQPFAGSFEAFVDEMKTLENRLQADELGRKIAADSKRIQIDFPS
jgi:thiamine biosynthesis protein ThiI